MQRISLTFLFAIILPAIVLAGFGLYAVRAQSQILAMQEKEILLAQAEDVAAEIDAFFDDLRVFYGDELERFISTYDGDAISEGFSTQFPERWDQIISAAAIAAGKDTTRVSQAPQNDKEFFLNNADLWKKGAPAEISQAPALLLNKGAIGIETESADGFVPKIRGKLALNRVEPQVRQRIQPSASAKPALGETLAVAESAPISAREQIIKPPPRPTGTPFSLGLTQRDPEGAFSRMQDGELHTLFWRNHPNYPDLTFWVEIDQKAIEEGIEQIISFEPFSKIPQADLITTQVHNLRGQLVARSSPLSANPSSRAQTEISPLLPGWTVSAIGSPAPFAARFAQQLSIVTILFFLGLVLLASWLLSRSIRSEMRLAAQKTDFVGNVSHELKTPLTSIRMFSEMLQQNPSPDTEKVSDYAGIIEKESRRLGRLIHRLLDFSQLDRGTMKLNATPVDLQSLTESALALCRPDLEEAGIETTIDWKAPPSVSIYGDADLLTQVITNLLTNACKYASVGKLIEISSSTEEQSQKFCLTIADRGPGIPRHALRKIFEKFYRLDNSLTAEQSGAGIGLALCQEIIQLHGGSVSARNRQNGGTAFEVRLPLSAKKRS